VENKNVNSQYVGSDTLPSYPESTCSTVNSPILNTGWPKK